MKTTVFLLLVITSVFAKSGVKSIDKDSTNLKLNVRYIETPVKDTSLYEGAKGSYYRIENYNDKKKVIKVDY